MKDHSNTMNAGALRVRASGIKYESSNQKKKLTLWGSLWKQGEHEISDEGKKW